MGHFLTCAYLLLPTVVLALGGSHPVSLHHRHPHPIRQDSSSSVPAETSIATAQASSITPTATISYALNQPKPTVPVHQAGEVPGGLDGAPPLPQPFVYTPGIWPTADKVPPLDSPEVAEWLKELQGHDIPDFAPTKDGTCGGDPEAAAKSEERGWWTCGGVTRDTDIVACLDKGTWGVSFDDGPGEYTPNLLKYLEEKEIKATFFVVGSRIMELPNVLVEEHMLGHEISVHTWSHSKPLTSMSNAEIVAELGWTRKAVQEVIGVTPTTMRPPWGDMDDRVRAVSMAMGLIPIMWTRGAGSTFDTNDWKIPAGEVTIDQSIATFDHILDTAAELDTGFIVLAHDMWEINVAMATQTTLQRAMSHNPPFKLEKIGQCMHMPPTDLYRETSKNATFPWGTVTGMVDVDGDGEGDVTVLAGKVEVKEPLPPHVTATTKANASPTGSSQQNQSAANQVGASTSNGAFGQFTALGGGGLQLCVSVVLLGLFRGLF